MIAKKKQTTPKFPSCHPFTIQNSVSPKNKQAKQKPKPNSVYVCTSKAFVYLLFCLSACLANTSTPSTDQTHTHNHLTIISVKTVIIFILQLLQCNHYITILSRDSSYYIITVITIMQSSILQSFPDNHYYIILQFLQCNHYFTILSYQAIIFIQLLTKLTFYLQNIQDSHLSANNCIYNQLWKKLWSIFIYLPNLSIYQFINFPIGNVNSKSTSFYIFTSNCNDEYDDNSDDDLYVMSILCDNDCWWWWW